MILYKENPKDSTVEKHNLPEPITEFDKVAEKSTALQKINYVSVH